MRNTRSFLVAIVAACGSGPQTTAANAPAPVQQAPASATVWARQFDTSCTADGDCVAIYEGPCQPCACANAAIRRAALGAYEAFVQAHAACFDATRCGADCIDVAGGPSANVQCVAGTCKYVLPP